MPIATCQRNITQHCWPQHVAYVWQNLLRHVGCCRLKIDQFQTRANNTQHVATHRNTVAKRTQHIAPNNVALACCDRLAGAYLGHGQTSHEPRRNANEKTP